MYNKMEHTLNHGMCRCCASEGMFKNFSATYQWMGADEVYSDMLKECFDITLTNAEDCNNGGICEVCITQLRNASNFKKQVLQTEEQFKKMVQDNLLKSNIVKVEHSKDDDVDSEPDNLSDPDYSGAEFEVPVKEEVIEPRTRKRAAKASTSSAKKAKTEDGEPSSKRDSKKNNRRKKLTLRYDEGESEDDEQLDDKEIEEARDRKLRKIKMVGVRQKEVEKHKHNIREILLNSNATPIKCYAGKGYACSFCPEQFLNPADLKEHTINDHDCADKNQFMKDKEMHGYLVKLDITELECKLCDEKIDTVESLMVHLSNEHKKEMFLNLKNHILPFKFDDSSLTCFMCNNVFNTFKALLEHMNSHYRNYICKECSAGFVNKNTLLRHSYGHQVGWFPCGDCSQVFDTARKKALHERKHKTQLPHKCAYCPERFKEIWTKKSHMMQVHDVKGPGIKCKACGKEFASKQGWRMHSERVHLMLRNFKCDECEMAFHTKRELDFHMVKHTGTRDFKCDVCFKRYGRFKTMREHRKRAHS